MNYRDDDMRKYGDEGDGDLLEGSADESEDEDEVTAESDKEEEEYE